MWIKNLPSLALVLLICAGSAGLATQKDAVKTARFKKLDLNHDGKVSPAELRASSVSISKKRLKTVVKDFGNYDNNDDGYLSLTEFKAIKTSSL